MKRATLLLFLFVMGIISAAPISDKLNLNIQTTDTSGNKVTGTFDFVFNITSDSNCQNVLYSDSTTLTTDSRGVISYYLENITLPFNEAYYLCYYRGGTLKSNSELVNVPYSFNSKYLGGYDENFFMPLNTSAVGTFSGITSGDSQLLDGFDSGYLFPLNTSVSAAQFDFNTGWTTGGVSIIGGDVYMQTLFTTNITNLDVGNLNVNGSLLPQAGFDNQFDLGSSGLQWNDIFAGGTVTALSFVGDLIGNADTATTASSVTKSAISNSGTLSFDWSDSEVADDIRAGNLDGIDSSQFLRSDTGDTMSGALEVGGYITQTGGYQIRMDRVGANNYIVATDSGGSLALYTGGYPGTSGQIGLTVDSSGDLSSSGSLTVNGGVDAGGTGTYLKTKVIDIGDWNMDTTASISVAHGLSLSVIRDVSANIFPDTGAAIYSIYGTNAGGSLRGQITTSDINVALQRTNGGQFDSTSFDSTSFNRGYIIITYG